MKEFEIRNDAGKIVAQFPTADLASRYVKHHQPDGIYQLVGPGVDLILERSNGTVYPTAGTVDGQKLPPRSLPEAKEVFDQ